MNLNEGVLQTFEQTEVKSVDKKKFDNELHSLIIFKRSAKYLKCLNLFLKRMIDVLGALIGTIILIPLTVVVFIGNRICKDKGPIFYTQERIGQYGKTFKMYKFRSMVVDAEKKLEDLLESDERVKEEYGVFKKLKDDPRVTKFGTFIRKTSLDEFPQFINVLKGEMSLVGPRAYLLSEKEDMGEMYHIIIQHNPGITGMWQVSGRSNVTFEERLNIDWDYHQNSSLFLDIQILFKTVFAVLKKNGAE